MPTNPELLKMPFAQDGDKNSIPETTSPTTGLFSQQYGFQNINSLPLTAGGKAISRLDYNGAMYMLSNLLYYMQRGYTFVYDNTMNYLVGCQVLDPNDGQVYICTADAVAGTGVPSATPANWEMVPNAANLDLKVNPTFDNVVTHKETFATSGTFEAPVTGLYRITLQGGGGGGGCGYHTANRIQGGGGGGEGGHLEFYEKLIAGQTYSYTIGAGGSGAAAGSSDTAPDGGDSAISLNSNSYVAEGGLGGMCSWSAGGGGGCGGGQARINGTVVSVGQGGSAGNVVASGTFAAPGGIGGRSGTSITSTMGNSVLGAGGNGGNGSADTSANEKGGNGGDGFITFEWLDTSLL